MIDIRLVRYTEPVATGLVEAALADLSARYGGEGDSTPVDPGEFAPPRGGFLVAWRDGTPVGCGGWRTYHGDPVVAEIKRMYTIPAARGQGVALALLRALEEAARQAGRNRIVLETGSAQPEAIGLYVKAGYARIPDFGHYKDEPGVRSYGKDL
ncbi:MAG: GNAT family N-acetyltransferase [Actinobacteria bacterium 13_2_20CM_2_72_6]|nr:MAG: GNAT family N-acetyltransferase [Actinobacteria bacterium 13_2_20CM_2_72_6]